MQKITLEDGTELAYRFDGPDDAPVVLLSSALGTTHAMFDAQIPATCETHRVLRYDMRGHGASTVTPGPYTIERLGGDVLGLLDALELETVAYCGLSIGGMIGLWLGAHAKERLSAMILANSSARTANPEAYRDRIAKVLDKGMDAIVEPVLANWFTAGFREHHPETVQQIGAMLRNADPEGYAATCAAVRDMNLESALPAIATKTLVIVGTHDPATPPALGMAIARAINGSYLVELDAAHLSNIEQSEGFNVAMTAFLQN